MPMFFRDLRDLGTIWDMAGFDLFRGFLCLVVPVHIKSRDLRDLGYI